MVVEVGGPQDDGVRSGRGMTFPLDRGRRKISFLSFGWLG